jgi:glycosyltransferase involved in cell wall biosynthesis
MTPEVEKLTVLCLSTSSGPGGAERVISVLSEALNQDGMRFIVGLFRPGWLQTECQRLGVETRVIPLAWPLHLKWFLDCLRLVRHENIGLIHAHEFSAIVYGWLVSRLAGVPFVGTIHGKNYFWEKLRRRVAYRIIARTGRLVAVSEDLKRFTVDKVGIPVSRVQVIYNGVEPGLPVSDAEIDRCRTDLGLGAGDLVIGTVGSLYPVKGHQYLLEAMPAVLKQFPNSVLLLIGRGDLEVSLKDQAKRLGIEERVRFLGMRHDVPKLLAVMDVFVLPSLSEGLSMALLEAMVSGKPVVATRVGGNPELVNHGQTGLLVNSEDAQDLAGSLITILNDRTMLQEFGQAGADRVLRHFSMDQMVRKYRDLYGHLLTSMKHDEKLN